MIFENLVAENKEAFLESVEGIASRLGIKPDWLMLVFYIETAASVYKKIDHRIQNTKSKATGLIQFMPTTAKSLSTTVDKLKSMSNVDQLVYVEKYLNPYKGKMKSPTDVYLAVFFPAAIGKPNSFILEAKGLPARTVALWNPLYDLDKNGLLEKGEVERKVLSFIPKDTTI